MEMETAQPEHPLGYLLEAKAIWWNIWCTSAELKYGMTFPGHRAKLAADRRALTFAFCDRPLFPVKFNAGRVSKSLEQPSVGATAGLPDRHLFPIWSGNGPAQLLLRVL